MFVKQRKSSTDPRLRSLLQKAVRRGYSDTVEKTARQLELSKDNTWLRSRAVVITFEECWPLAQELLITKYFDSRLTAFLQVASSEKYKDAAGLGALAYAFSEGDKTTLDYVPDRRALLIVSVALRRPLPFFEWAKTKCHSPSAEKIVAIAQQYLPAATWGWDKACIIAGAFLATTGTINTPRSGVSSSSDDFPYWVALDKHTPQGKDVFHLISEEKSISYRQLIWCSFYFESAKVNVIAESPWWIAERKWRLAKAGLTISQAEKLWGKFSPIIEEKLYPEVKELKKIVEKSIKNIQYRLF